MRLTATRRFFGGCKRPGDGWRTFNLLHLLCGIILPLVLFQPERSVLGDIFACFDCPWQRPRAKLLPRVAAAPAPATSFCLTYHRGYDFLQFKGVLFIGDFELLKDF